jgi:hypothetical protein
MQFIDAVRTRALVAAAALVACSDSSPTGTGTETGASGGISMSASGTTEGSAGTDATGSPDTSVSAEGSAATSDGSVDTSGGSGTTTATTGVDSSGGGETTSESRGEASGTSAGVVPCDVAEATLEPVTPNIMLVLDKSGSMISNTWDHDANGGTPEVTRWYSLYQVVDFVVTTFDAQINFGANLFPAENATNQYNANACIVGNAPEIPVAPMNQAAILGGIPGAGDIDIFGGTPATTGFTVARDHLVGLNPGTPRAAIFVTDGAANCSADAVDNFQRFEVYDDELPIVVGDAWTDDGIPTYVVGIDILDAISPVVNDGNPDNTNLFDELNTVAVAGGVPNGGAAQFYQTTNQNELQDALQQIIDDALSCIVPLDPEPAFPELLEIYVDDMMVPPVMDCATEDGWVYSTPAGPYDSIELCGTWCDALKVSGSLTAEYYCNAG